MIYVGVDTGATTGIAIYCTEQRRVLLAGEYTDLLKAKDDIIDIKHSAMMKGTIVRLAVEGLVLYRTDNTRPGGNVVGESTFAATREVGWWCALFGLLPTGPHILPNPIIRNLLVGWLPAKMRTEPVVNQYLKDQHGGEDSTRKALEPVEGTYRKDGSVWRKAVPGRAQGALWGVSGHAWNALACAVAAAKRDGFWVAR